MVDIKITVWKKAQNRLRPGLVKALSGRCQEAGLLGSCSRVTQEISTTISRFLNCTEIFEDIHTSSCVETLRVSLLPFFRFRFFYTPLTCHNNQKPTRFTHSRLLSLYLRNFAFLLSFLLFTSEKLVCLFPHNKNHNRAQTTANTTSSRLFHSRFD
jgi:hypothetical protein